MHLHQIKAIHTFRNADDVSCTLKNKTKSKLVNANLITHTLHVLKIIY